MIPYFLYHALKSAAIVGGAAVAAGAAYVGTKELERKIFENRNNQIQMIKENQIIDLHNHLFKRFQEFENEPKKEVFVANIKPLLSEFITQFKEHKWSDFQIVNRVNENLKSWQNQMAVINQWYSEEGISMEFQNTYAMALQLANDIQKGILSNNTFEDVSLIRDISLFMKQTSLTFVWKNLQSFQTVFNGLQEMINWSEKVISDMSK